MSVDLNYEANGKRKFPNIYDKVITQLLDDAISTGNNLRLTMRVFDPQTKRSEFDVKDSLVLKLMYGL